MAFDNISYTAIDLFCGAGGLSLGLENAGIHVALGIEINPIAAATYQNNLTGTVIVKDIKQITGKMILDALNMSSGDLFLVAGCPPCQTFSSLQKANISEDERDNLIDEYVRIVLELKPLFIQLENVPGLKRGRGKNIFENAVSLLSNNYEINSEILNCADFGIPQRRRRLLLHGIRKDAYNLLVKYYPSFTIEMPSKTHTQHPTPDSGLMPWIPAKKAFENLPPISAGDPAPPGYPNHETNNLSPINIQRIQYIQTHGGSRDCLPSSLQLPCHKKNKVGYTGVYGIIDTSIPAPTMTGGCITYSKGRYGHPTQPRAISVREAARLQSFPDTYVFLGTRGQTALQVGNAVPPLLAQASGHYFISVINKLHTLPT